MVELPNLVLDRILCHAIGSQTSQHDYIDQWHAYLMVAPPPSPRFVRKLLRQCRAFAVTAHTCPPLAVLHAWLRYFTLAELDWDLDAMVSAALKNGCGDDILDWICTEAERGHIPYALSARVVDAASGCGVAALDRVWQHHCSGDSGAKEFPYTTDAVDNALTVDVLDWWWHKHVGHHAMPFMFYEAVSLAFTARMYESVTGDPGAPHPDHLDQCRWWHRRATVDGLSLIGRCAPSNSSRSSAVEACELLENELTLLGERGLHETLAVWGELVDKGHFKSHNMAPDECDQSILSNARMFDARVLDWWLDRHLKQEFAFPMVDAVLGHASAVGRVDTLDWVWNASQQENGLVFVAPDRITVSHATLHTVPTWWIELARTTHGVVPVFEWEFTPGDTCDDLQEICDLPLRYPGTSIAIDFQGPVGTANAQVLAWISKYNDAHGKEIAVNVVVCFEHAWKEVDIKTLRSILARPRTYFDEFPIASFACSCVTSNPHEPMAILQWWRKQLGLFGHFKWKDVNKVIGGALAAAQFEQARWWVHHAREKRATISPSQVMEQMCQDSDNWDHAKRIRASEWVLREFGRVEFPPKVLDRLLKSTDIAVHMFLDWLAVDGIALGFKVELCGEEQKEMRAEWEVRQRAAKLWMLQ